MKIPIQEPDNNRQGVILLVVLAMLTLLAIIGITFVMYASSLEQVSEAVLDEQKADYKPRMDPETALNLILGQLVYDVKDDTFGKASVVRGHSLARGLYGYTNQTFPLDRPFGGSGFSDPNTLLPELNKVNFFGQTTVSGQPNVGYTAPDTRHWFLAKTRMDPNTKAMVIEEPSFWRNAVSSGSTSIFDQKTFRYRPGAEMAPGFPAYPPQTGKYDVINLPGGTVEDSIWIDINSPIQTLANGKKYKMMVAPLIIDLDGRLNLNWAGNRMARDPVNFVHGSHEGYGPWEANLDKLMAAMGENPQQSNVLDTKYGGQNALPDGYFFAGGGSGSSSGGYSPRAHFQVDFNGGVDVNQNGGSGVPAMLPGAGGGFYFHSFPYFTSAVFGNWSHIETSANGMGGNYIHPVGYNPSFPGGSNMAFKLRDLGPLLLWNSKKDQDFYKSPATNTYPIKSALFPHLDYYGDRNSKRPFLDTITLHSADFDKPGISGYFSDRKSQGLLWADASIAPFYPRHPVPFAGPGGSPLSEFNTVGLAIKDLTRFARINLAQIGADYPAIDPATGLYPTDAGSQAQVSLATKSRLLLATKVLDGLCSATGTPDMRPTADLANPQYKAWVWLAQLAVNIVDFIDPDDVMTVLDLSPTNAPGTGRKLYGTELPKVVLNELYAQADNTQADFAKTSGNATDDYTVSVFMELLNPTPSSLPPVANNVNRTNDAYIQIKNGMTLQSVYQLELAASRPLALNDPFASDRSGEVNFSTTPHSFGGTPSSITTWKDASDSDTNPLILPPSWDQFSGNAQTGDKGILLIGPKLADNICEAFGPSVTPLEQSTLRYTWPKNQATAPEATILLRRLANPGLAPEATTNPYVLVDFATLKPEMVQDARKRTNSGVNAVLKPVAERKSYGRRQPYAGKEVKDASTGATKDLGAYIESAKTNVAAPLHTFGQLNFTSQPIAFAPSNGTNAETPDWLVHYDRQLVSPAGLLLVSTFRPHELTQKFVEVDSTTKRSIAHQHASAWMDETTGLHRFLDMVQCHGEYFLSNSSGKAVALLPSGGRMMGRVNLNTMPLDETGNLSPVLDALLDANTASHFSPDSVRSVARSLASARSAGNYITTLNPWSRMGSLYSQGSKTPLPNLDPWDQQYRLQWDPFVGTNQGINGAPDLTQSGSVHPLVRLEMLDKILNQTTIRSNVFGIWLTVGFFEVTDSTTLPVKLGGEIGAAAGRQTRYKLFAAVDRTRIKAYETSATGAITQANIDGAIDPSTGDFGNLPVPINTNQPFKEILTNNPTNIEPRTGNAVNLLALAQAQALVLTIDPDTVDEETVEAQFAGGQLWAVFRRPHALGAKIISRGNPGPMKDYKVNDDPDVVFYWTILE